MFHNISDEKNLSKLTEENKMYLLKSVINIAEMQYLCGIGMFILILTFSSLFLYLIEKSALSYLNVSRINLCRFFLCSGAFILSALFSILTKERAQRMERKYFRNLRFAQCELCVGYADQTWESLSLKHTEKRWTEKIIILILVGFIFTESILSILEIQEIDFESASGFPLAKLTFLVVVPVFIVIYLTAIMTFKKKLKNRLLNVDIAEFGIDKPLLSLCQEMQQTSKKEIVNMQDANFVYSEYCVELLDILGGIADLRASPEGREVYMKKFKDWNKKISDTIIGMETEDDKTQYEDAKILLTKSQDILHRIPSARNSYLFKEFIEVVKKKSTTLHLLKIYNQQRPALSRLSE